MSAALKQPIDEALTWSIRVLSADCEARWDAYVMGHPSSMPYHLLAWRDSIQHAYQHRPYYLFAENHSREVCGVLPLFEINIPFGSRKFVSLPFCDAGGPLADSEKIAADLLAFAESYAVESGASALDIRHSPLPASLLKQSFDAVTIAQGDIPDGKKVSMILALPDSADSLSKGFKSKLRSQINKAKKNGLTFRAGNSDRELHDFYAVFVRNMRDLGSPVHAFELFKQVIAGFGRQSTIGVVSLGDVPVGAGLLLFCGDRVSIPWASTRSDYNRLAPNMLLYWGLLEYSCDRGCRLFDFGRSSFGEGTYRFKKQWGAAAMPLEWVDVLQPSSTTRDGVSKPGRARRWVENLWRRLPLALTNILGPRIRRYITL